MDLAPTVLRVSRAYARRRTLRLAASSLLLATLTAVLWAVLPRRPVLLPPPFDGVADGTALAVAGGLLATTLVAFLVVALRRQARAFSEKAWLVVSRGGLEVARGGLVPWHEVAAVYATATSLPAQLVHVVLRPGFARRRAAIDKGPRWRSRWSGFMAPVVTGRTGALTVSLHAAALDLEPEALVGLIERYRTAANAPAA